MHDNLSYQRVLTSVRSIIRLLNQKNINIRTQTMHKNVSKTEYEVAFT